MSAFRPLRPSNSLTPGDAQSSTEGASQGGSGDDRNPSGSGKSRKRRAPTHVSQNACTNCKRARAKCDGNEPDPCSRCTARDIADQCHYEIHVKTQKEEMVRRIRTLEQQNAELQGSVKEKDYHISAIFEALKNNDKGPEALSRLRAGQSYQEIVAWLGHPPYGDVARLSPGSETKLVDIVHRYEMSMSLNPQAPEGETQVHWTTVTSNERLTHHLMALFFAWVHPVHMLFSERHFMESFRRGDGRYCSSALVNVMCATGCFYLVDQGGSESQAKELMKRFLNQALLDVAKEDPKTLTYASAYAMLFVVELGLCQARKAAPHLRLAVEAFHKIDTSAYANDAVELTAWGIHSLNGIWSAITYQKTSSPSPPRISPDIEIDKPDAYWQLYRFPQDNAAPQVPSHAIETARELAKLTRIIHETVEVYCGSRESVTARSIMLLYRRYLEWKNFLPSSLTISTDRIESSSPLPHVIFLNVIYHVALCQIFRPLLEHDDFPAATRSHFYNITIQSALDGMKLMKRYQHLYTHRYQCPLLAFCVVHVAEILVRGGRSMGDFRSKAAEFALKATHESLPGFQEVGPLQYMFCRVVVEEGVQLPENVEELMGGRTEYGAEELLDACGRLSYTQPLGWLQDRINPSLGSEFEEEWKQFIEAHGRGNQSPRDAMSRESSDETYRSGGRSGSQSSAGGSTTSARSMQINSVVNP